MLTENELIFLDLIVIGKGDIEYAERNYAAKLREQFVSQMTSDTGDPELLKVIDETVDRKVKQMLPAIGTAFIKQGKLLGGRLREKISTNNKESV